MAGTNLTSTGNKSAQKKVKTGGIGVDLSGIIELKNLTNDVLNKYFPELKEIKYILYICMCIWFYENTYHLINPKTKTSQHSTSNKGSKWLATGYGNDPLIVNLLKSPATTQVIKDNIEQGYFAHGYGGALGVYLIKGGRIYTDFRASVAKNLDAMKADGLVMEIAPGASITDIYKNNDLIAKKSSIGICIAVLLEHYKIAKSKLSGGKASPLVYLAYAVSNYVGPGRDPNGETGENRLFNIINASNPGLKKLLAPGVGFAQQDSTDLQAAGKTVLAALKTAPTGSGNTSVASSSSPTTASTGSSGVSNSVTGCV